MSRAKSAARTRAETRQQSKANPAATSLGAWRGLAGRKLYAVLCALLAAATIALYCPVLGHRFVLWDDHEYITGNPHLKDGLSWKTVKWAFASTYASNWHPLTWLSHALDYQLFALNPAGHHFDSVLIHALNVVLLFLLLAWVTKRIGPSLLVAALFAVHPLNVQSVAWAAERKNVLSTMFFLLAIAAYVKYAQKPDWRRYLIVAALFAAGLMAKPMVITLPFVLLLLDYWPLERIAFEKISGSPPSAAGVRQFSMARLALEKVPLLALSAASAWITLVAQRSGHAVRSFEEYPFGVRLENALVAYGLYLWKMIWPARLAVLYPHPGNALPIWQVVLSTIILASMTALVLIFRKQRYLPVGWFWFLGTLVPVIGLVQVGEAAMADRYAYIPLIGIFIMIAWGLDDWAQAREVSLLWRVAPAIFVVIALAFVTFRQLGTWESEYTLWAHAVEVTEGNPYAHAVLGNALLHPDVAMTAEDLKSFDTEQKRAAEARRQLEEALGSYRQLVQQSPNTYLPDMATTLANLGNVAVSQNKPEEARQDYEEAMQYYHQLEVSNPEPHLQNIATALNNLASVDRRENRVDEACKNYEEALKIYRQIDRQEPGSHQQDVVTALINLGSLEGATGQTNKAYAHFEEALTLGRQLAQQNPNAYLPNLANRLNNFGTFEREHNRLAEARAHYEEALKIYREMAEQENPGWASFEADQAGSGTRWLPEMVINLNNLGDLDMFENRRDDARRDFEGALDLSRKLVQQSADNYLPTLAGALNNLGRLDGLENRLGEAGQHFEGASEIYHRLAQRDPRFLPDLAGTLNSLAIVARLQKHPDASLAYYTQALSVYRVLAQHDPSQFSNDVARVGASVAELGRERHR